MDIVVERAAEGKARSDGDLRNRVSHAVDRLTKLVGTCYDRTCTITAGLTITLGHNYETACKPTSAIVDRSTAYGPTGFAPHD